MLGPRVYEDFPRVDLEVNVRVLEGDDEGQYAIDGVYAYEGVEPERFLAEIYPGIVAEFEAAFAEADLRYYEPDM